MDFFYLINSSGRVNLTPETGPKQMPSYCEDYDLHFALKGEGAIKINEHLYKMMEGDLVLVKPGETFHVQTPKTEFNRIFVHFTPLPVRPTRLGDREEEWEPHLFRQVSVRQYREIKNLLLLVVREGHSNEKMGREMASSYLSQAIFLLTRFANKKTVQGQDQQVLKNFERLEAVKKLIENQFTKTLSLQSLANFAGLSVNHFSRLFKKCYGQSPYDYLLQVRIDKAKDELIENDGSISQVAELAGFKNLFEFSAAFKKRVGVSPTQFILELKDSKVKHQIYPR